MRIGLALLALLGCAPVPSEASACEARIFDGARFTICRIDMERDDLRLFHAGPDGTPFGSFRAVNEALRPEGSRLGVAMNAGMYHSDRAPVGLYVEQGRETTPIVTSEGPGNFGLLPNGVFCIAGDRARVVESRRFAEERLECDYATQSGPMLVIDGELHPHFLPDGTSTYVRNGVGVSPDGRAVYLAISEQRVNFDLFGRLFRDALGAEDALFLDGNISRLYDSASGRHDAGFPMGPIIGTVEGAE